MESRGNSSLGGRPGYLELSVVSLPGRNVIIPQGSSSQQAPRVLNEYEGCCINGVRCHGRRHDFDAGVKGTLFFSFSRLETLLVGINSGIWN